jgi:hypothetical protein
MDIKKVSKAIAGMLAAIVAGQLVKWLGSLYTPDVDEALRIVMDLIVTGVLGYFTVYLAPKNKEA